MRSERGKLQDSGRGDHRSEQEMDGRDSNEDSVARLVEQLQHERDELRKDIEQLCTQQSGPGYLSVATRMHFQRTAALEQEIESMKKKLAGCTRDKQNLEEELSEAYRIKSQLADLHNAEVLKNKEAEKQVKFFQGCVASAFAERDQALMESEKAKEREEPIWQKLTDLENRTEEFRSAYVDEKKLNDTLQIELMQVKEQNECFEKVINKFFDIHERDAGVCACNTWQEKCSLLLSDPPDRWTFSGDGSTTTLKYIASLEEELETLRNSLDKLQYNLRMGLDIEHHLKKRVMFLERKQMSLEDAFRNGLFTLRDFQKNQRIEVMKILEDETTQLKLTLNEVQDKIHGIQMDREFKLESLPREKVSDDSECRDVHITNVIDANVPAKRYPETSTFGQTPDVSDALEQVLQEKVAALLLLSQQEERHLLEIDVNKALQRRIAELQRNLSQVTNEKVNILMELAQLKKEYQLLQENYAHAMKHGIFSKDAAEKGIIVHEQEGKLKNILKRTYLTRWIGKDFNEHKIDFHHGTKESTSADKKNQDVDIARFKVENATLRESLANMERLTASIHRLHISLLKVKDDAASGSPIDNMFQALEKIIIEATHMKTALVSCLPISWPADAADAALLYTNLYESNDPSDVLRSGKVDPVSASGFEMAELLILAAQLLKKNLRDTESTNMRSDIADP